MVVLPVSGSEKIKIGRVADEAVSRDDSFDEDYVHVRKVQWLKDVDRSAYSQAARYNMGAFLAVFLGAPTVLQETLALLEGERVNQFPEADGDEPYENLEDVLKTKLDDFISGKIDQNKGHGYTHIIAALLRAMGYHTEVAPPGPDGKRDIMAYPDELHLRDPMIRVEVKSSKNAIDEDGVRALNGALRGGERGLFVARSGYTTSARKFARDLPQLTLLDGADVVDLLLNYYEKLDTDVRALIPLRRVWIPAE